MQETQVRALVQEDPTCCGATKPGSHSYWACALEPTSHNYWSLHDTTTEARAPRARAPPQGKPPQWEACSPQRRVAPLAATRESPRVATKTQHSQLKKKKKVYVFWLVTLVLEIYWRESHQCGQRFELRDFPGGPVVKNLPYNAGDSGSIPGQGTKIPHAVEQLNPHATTTELAHLS